MNNWGKEKTDETDQISPSTWKEYFTKLLNDTNEGNNSVNDETTPNFIPTFQPILDRQISMAELRKALLLLKNHKAAGCDRITAARILKSLCRILWRYFTEDTSKAFCPTCVSIRMDI